MNIVIVYETRTGITAKAAEQMGKILEEYGHQCQVLSISGANPAEILEADLICVGAWVKGLFIILQHPSEGVINFVKLLGDLSGKKAVAFCTYKLAIGSTLSQMAKVLEDSGATVVGRFKYRGPEPNKEFAAFAASLTSSS